MKQAKLSACLLLCGVFATSLLAAPFIRYDLATGPAGGRIQDATGAGVPLRLGKGASVIDDATDRAPSGTPFLRFDGTEKALSSFEPGAAAKSRLKGEELAVSLWFRLPVRADQRGAALGLGFTAPPKVEIMPIPTILGKRPVTAPCDRPVVTGRWHHVAYTYSLTDSTFAYYFDGRLQKRSSLSEESKAAIQTVLPPLGRNISADVADIRIWDKVPDERELLSFVPGPQVRKAAEESFARAATALPGTPFAEWCEKNRKMISTTAREPVTIGEWAALADNARKAPTLSGWIASDRLARSLPFCPIAIDPFSHAKRLPHLLPHDGESGHSLRMAAARGEFETVSFQIFPFRDIKRTLVVASDLVAVKGNAKIPSKEIDIKIVKVWHSPDGSWATDRPGNIGFPTLIPNLLLHDDDLVRVDETNRINYLRIDDEDGAKYVNMVATGRKSHFNHDLEPVRDAKTLQLLDLRADRLQQFWVTVRTPVDAAPGIYRGTLDIREEGRSIGTLDLSLRVYPFELPTPRTHYDSSREYYCSMMNNCTVEALLKEGHDLENAKRKCHAMYKNMVDHNFRHSSGPGAIRSDGEDDLGAITLRLMKKAGMPLDLLFSGPGVDGWWYNNDGNPKSPEEDPAFYQESLKKHAAVVDPALDAIEKIAGTRKNAFFGWDECEIWGSRRQFGFWSHIKEKGGEIFQTTPGDAAYISPYVDHADIPAKASFSEAARWHAGDARIYTYAATFTGPECPDIWRRNKGLRFYFSDFDGLNEHVWYVGENRWNEFVWWGTGYRQFGIVYPTFDGVVDTIAWDALREGIDDVRYLSLLRLEAEEAMRSEKTTTALAGRQAIAWVESHDPETIVDLSAFRAQVAEKAIALRKLLGKEGE